MTIRNQQYTKASQQNFAIIPHKQAQIQLKHKTLAIFIDFKLK